MAKARTGLAQADLDALRHGHDFLGENHDRNARKTWIVMVFTAVMMVVEIAYGLISGSMALLADGLHMATHAGAMLITAGAYMLARKHNANPRFSFGAGKFGDLAAYTSAIILAGTAAVIAWESIVRLVQPTEIHFGQALPVAIIGLVVNLISAWLLRDEHHHHGHEEQHGEHDHGHDHPDHSHDHGHDQGHRDLNLRAAYLHVAADAAVSVLAIIGLLAAQQLGWAWMDPVVGIVGAIVITRWAWSLLKEAGGVLLDMTPNETLRHAIEHELEEDGDHVTDLHLWRVGPGSYAALASVVTPNGTTAQAYKNRLTHLTSLRHVSIEVLHRTTKA